MARNELPDQEVERRLREHFEEEARDLRAPDDLWARLQGRLGKQQPPRFGFLRGGAPAIGGRPWVPAAAAAVVVVAVGMGVWALAGGAGDSGGEANDTAAPVAAAARERAEATQAAATEAAATAYATQAAATEAAAAERAYAQESDAEATQVAATEAAAVQAAAATPAAMPAPTAAAAEAAVAATEAAASEAPPEQVAVATPAATPAAESEPPAAEDAPVPPDDSAADEAMDDGAPPEDPAAAEPVAADESDDEMMADESMDDDMGYADAGDEDMADASYDEEEAEEEADDSMAAVPPANVGGGPPQQSEPEPPPPQQPSGTTFEDYGRIAFVDTSTDAVSTFSLDTDRTSYFLALAWVSDGYTVEPDSVRAEEWINAFDFGYTGPADDSSFAITSELVQHPLDGDWHIARIALQAPDVRDDTPLNVTLVLDASGSMDLGNRVAIARAAAEAIRQSLGDRDRIAVVHFTTDVLDAYTVEHSSPDDEDVEWSIGRLAAHDSTNVQAGLNLGVQLADEARRERPDAFNYIILMSDGVANVDATDPFAILESAPDTDSKNPLRLITIGVGIDNYNDVLLEQLAQQGNGWYRYLDGTAQAKEMFSRQNWLALSTPFADQARAQVIWDPAVVKAWRIVGYENRVTPDHTFEQDRKEFAELPSGTATTVFYELDLHEGVSASAALGSVEVRWVDPASGASVSQSVSVTGRTDASFGTADRYLRLGAIVGLAGDRYSALSPQVENAEVDYAGIHADLSALRNELEALRGSLGALQAYRDFDYLLDRLTAAAAELAPSSGYSQ